MSARLEEKRTRESGERHQAVNVAADETRAVVWPVGDAGEIVWDVRVVDYTPGFAIGLEVVWVPDSGVEERFVLHEQCLRTENVPP